MIVIRMLIATFVADQKRCRFADKHANRRSIETQKNGKRSAREIFFQSGYNRVLASDKRNPYRLGRLRGSDYQRIISRGIRKVILQFILDDSNFKISWESML